MNLRIINCSIKYFLKIIDGIVNLIYEIWCWIINWKMLFFVVFGFLYYLDYFLIRFVMIIVVILFIKFIILWIRKKFIFIFMFYKIGEDWSKVVIKKEVICYIINIREFRFCFWKVDLVEVFFVDLFLILVDICGFLFVW